MGNERTILDYGQPPPSVRQWIGIWFRWAWWFLFHRRLRASEIVIGGWVIMSAEWAIAPYSDDLVDLVCASTFYALLPITVITLGRHVLKRRWQPLVICCTVIALTGTASGILQIGSCPHATYLQLLGYSIPIAGKACNNPRDTSPWWSRG